jgi:hypothetical protein
MCKLFTMLFGEKAPVYKAPEVNPSKSSSQTQADVESRRIGVSGYGAEAQSSGALGDISRPKTIGISLGGA